MGIFDRLNVKVLGTPIRTLLVSEDRDLFAKALNGKYPIVLFALLCSALLGETGKKKEKIACPPLTDEMTPNLFR